MVIRVCSGFSPAGRKEYGDRFLRSFNRHWPASTQLLVYVEERTPMPRDAERTLWGIRGALNFDDRHRDDPAIAGREARPCWKSSERRKGYSFRTDALKFWKQILIPEAAALDLRAGQLEYGDILVWLDGDVDTLRPVPESLVPDLLGDAEVAFLGRDGTHSEIGFWAVRINARTLEFLHVIAEMYRTDSFLDLEQWHSAFVWDHVRRHFGLREKGLSPGGRGHVWPRSPLAPYMRHDKGRRKGLGR